MDPGTGLVILGSAAGGAKIIEKILGPTAEYVGAGVRNWTERRVANVSRIFRKANAKLGPKIDSAGGVPPKVLKEVLEEGSYCDEELTAEYFGGILASGRTPNGRDDRAAAYLRLTAQLTTYQVRCHYIIYTMIRRLFVGSGLRATFAEDVRLMSLHYPFEMLEAALDFVPTEPSADILLDTISGLRRHDLAECLSWGKAVHINETCAPHWPETWIPVPSPGVVFTPTQFGIDYYLWATGTGQVNRERFLDGDLPNVELEGVNLREGAVAVHRRIRPAD